MNFPASVLMMREKFISLLVRFVESSGHGCRDVSCYKFPISSCDQKKLWELFRQRELIDDLESLSEVVRIVFDAINLDFATNKCLISNWISFYDSDDVVDEKEVRPKSKTIKSIESIRFMWVLQAAIECGRT